MLAKTPDPLDVMVGARIRIFRTQCGMTQGELAGKIGVAAQQVQKYEKGINRVGASRLSRIATVLRISIGDLFESAGDQPAYPKSPFRLLEDRNALRVLTAFSRTGDLRIRRAIARLIESVAALRPAEKSSSKSSSTSRGASVKRLAPRRKSIGTKVVAATPMRP
jgi:transcriptional regulator with XRE-family HTH domain